MNLAGRPELATAPRFRTNAGRVEHREELTGLLQAVFAQQPAEHWVARCEQHGVAAAVVRSIDAVFAAPEAAASVFTVDDPDRSPLRYVRPPITMSGTPLADSRRPPLLGEHDGEILGR